MTKEGILGLYEVSLKLTRGINIESEETTFSLTPGNFKKLINQIFIMKEFKSTDNYFLTDPDFMLFLARKINLYFDFQNVDFARTLLSHLSFLIVDVEPIQEALENVNNKELNSIYLSVKPKTETE